MLFLPHIQVVILARALGMDMEVSDVEVESLLPQDLMDKVYEDVSRTAFFLWK